MSFTSGTPRSGYPHSRAALRRKMAKSDPLYAFLEYFAIHDVVHITDDFLGDAINLDLYAVANGGGAAVASFAINTQLGGVIRATTGTAGDDTASASLITPAQWYGDNLAGLEVRWKPITAITEAQIELGFSDVVPGSNDSVVDNLTTPTVNTAVVDAAIDVYDHTTATTTNALVTIGSSITAVDTGYTPVTAVAAATYTTTRIQLINNHAYLWRDGALVASHKTVGTDYVEGGSALAFWAYIKATNGTSKSLDLDYLKLWQERI